MAGACPGCKAPGVGPGPCGCGRLLEAVPSKAAGWWVGPGRFGWTSDPEQAKLRVVAGG